MSHSHMVMVSWKFHHRDPYISISFILWQPPTPSDYVQFTRGLKQWVEYCECTVTLPHLLFFQRVITVSLLLLYFQLVLYFYLMNSTVFQSYLYSLMMVKWFNLCVKKKVIMQQYLLTLYYSRILFSDEEPPSVHYLYKF